MTQPSFQSRRQYEWDICVRLKASQVVPFKEVSVGDWRPERSRCHDNVDIWIKSNPRHVAVRGWVVYASDGKDSVGLTAHTVVKDENGNLFDITPIEDERARPGMIFVFHLGNDVSFHALRSDAGIFFTCPPDMLDNISLSGQGQNPFNDVDHW